jgi:hypothetical protein
VVGIIATLVTDLWLRLLQIVGVPHADWALVGRWVAWMPRGVFVHRPIAATPSIRGELAHGVRQRAHGITPKLPLLYDLKGRFANRAMQRDGFAVNIAKLPERSRRDRRALTRTRARCFPPSWTACHPSSNMNSSRMS